MFSIIYVTSCLLLICCCVHLFFVCTCCIGLLVALRVVSIDCRIICEGLVMSALPKYSVMVVVSVWFPDMSWSCLNFKALLVVAPFFEVHLLISPLVGFSSWNYGNCGLHQL